jgi:phospholipase/carboxylesterase
MNGNTSKLQKFGPLKSLVVGDPSSIQPKVVIFHGYGADAHDLSSLARPMDPKGKKTWYFPNGLLTVPIGPGFTGRAWFPIDEAAWEKALQEGHGIAYGDRRPPGIDDAVQMALEFLQEIGFDPARDWLGGFSQGSMMAVDLVRHLPQAPRGILVLSGALVDESGFIGKELPFKNLPVFQSHGERDAILPMEGAMALKSRLQKMGARIIWQPFYGGHEIPMEVVSRAAKFLDQGQL